MASGLDWLHRMGPAGIVFKAIVAALAGHTALLAFILLRRLVRKRFFARRDARAFFFRQNWQDLISGKIPYETWRLHRADRRIVEELVLDALEAAGTRESGQLLDFLRKSGLLQKQIYEARKHHGWRRQRALVALGRTRAPEGISALAAGLRDNNRDTRLAAVRGLGRTGLPEAGKAILEWLGESSLNLPSLPVQTALVNCCRERPRLLLEVLAATQGELREVLARAVAEVANGTLETDLILLAGDPLPELRASAARAFGQTRPRMALPVLTALVEDRVWFVRLRATVALGELRTPLAIRPLLQALTDSHRLVRMRAAQALVEERGNLLEALEGAFATRDAYALDALITAAGNAGVVEELAELVRESPRLENSRREQLLAVLKQPIPIENGKSKQKTTPAGVAP